MLPLRTDLAEFVAQVRRGAISIEVVSGGKLAACQLIDWGTTNRTTKKIVCKKVETPARQGRERAKQGEWRNEGTAEANKPRAPRGEGTSGTTEAGPGLKKIRGSNTIRDTAGRAQEARIGGLDSVGIEK